VGYLSKPSGAFVTIFNCFTPEKSAIRTLPSVHGYGQVTTGCQRQDKRNAAQRGLDAIAGLLTFKKSEGPISCVYLILNRLSLLNLGIDKASAVATHSRFALDTRPPISALRRRCIATLRVWKHPRGGSDLTLTRSSRPMAQRTKFRRRICFWSSGLLVRRIMRCS
jgi:hypothetical protein